MTTNHGYIVVPDLVCCIRKRLRLAVTADLLARVTLKDAIVPAMTVECVGSERVPSERRSWRGQKRQQKPMFATC